eukprot:TRINITY_DN7972_c0_g1_i3.p1 TRINITY_DN7972_c0_g1~~TRINITY_DN7972_c0_g1_i3.p1  ORF type:complete len:492 (+),score=41.31 TRINITY_DN7972_c0_g1_i3:45-1520(+)
MRFILFLWLALWRLIYEPAGGYRVKKDILSSTTTADDTRCFFWLSDPHVDIEYGKNGKQCKQSVDVEDDRPNGMIGCDPPLKLMEAVAKAVAAHKEKCEFVLFTGDFVRHAQSSMDKPHDSVVETIQRTTHILNDIGNTVENTIVLGALGNDDSPRNYQLAIDENATVLNAWLSTVSNVFHGFSHISQLDDSYRKGGYYETSAGGLRILTINTIIYSKYHSPDTHQMADPLKQFEWLEARLKEAKPDSPVWIVGHIPPGMETYGHTELWHSKYMIRYRELIVSFGDRVAAQLFGHVHADEIRLWSSKGKFLHTGPTLLTGAISPIYSSVPCFRVVKYHATSQKLMDYDVYALEMENHNIPSGEKLSFAHAYRFSELVSSGTQPLTNTALAKFADKLAKDDSTWMAYAKWYKLGYDNDLQRCPPSNSKDARRLEKCADHVKAYTCGMMISTQEEYNMCRGIPQSRELQEVSCPEVLGPDYQKWNGEYMKVLL